MRSLLLLVLCLVMTSANAQKMSWRKHAKLAKKQLEEGNFIGAAENFEAAWTKKKKKKKYIYQAAECYYQLKDYRKAAECYEHVKEDNDDFMLPGLKYCRSLKMDGQYDEASRAFVYFINGYAEDDKEVVANIVQDEIRGCEMGMSFLEKKSNKVTFERLNNKVNSNEAEFAPIPFADDVLYYTSNMVGETKMYLTQKSNGVWSRSRVPKNFPKITAAHFGNGAFSPDNKTFFYTQCDQVDPTGRMLNGCEIYVTQRTNSNWSMPEKLNTNVNRKGSTTTHPFIVHVGDEEVLYFVSDRMGGQGGLDIWKSIRKIKSEKMNFSKPVNLGKNINTMADEITPFFDMEEKILFFSSNGKVNIGGFDIFMSKQKTALTWESPKNMGLPYNSNADDYYFTRYSPDGGYLVSNRKYGLEKNTYDNDDIFAFSIPEDKLMASGKILNGTTNEIMREVAVSIYEITSGGSIRLLENKMFENGIYKFALLPGKNYRIEANVEGFATAGAEFSTLNNNQVTFENDLVLGVKVVHSEEFDSTEGEKEMTTGTANGIFSNPQPTNENVGNAGLANNDSPVENAKVNTAPTAENLGNAGVVYKIQLMAVRKFRANDSRLTDPKNYGTIETEYLSDLNLTRVFLTSFQTREAAEQVLMEMKENRDFKTAVIVRYENGIRIDPWEK